MRKHTSDTEFHRFSAVCATNNTKLRWLYFQFDGEANSFNGAFELVAINFASSFKRQKLMNEQLGEKIVGAHVKSGFEDVQRPTIMKWLLSQPKTVK